MPQRLTPLEVSLLVLDTAHTPAHIGTVDIFDAGPDGWDYERLLGLIRERIAYVPRYRQRVRGVPARLAGPVWVDDENFDLTFHVRRSALPRPGTMQQLREFVGRVISRRLDRSRPLWEMYVVEGLETDRVALVTKSHLALVDGIDTVELGQVLFDNDASPATDPPAASEPWHPAPEPNDLELVVGALLESAQDPVQAVQNVRGVITGALGVAVAVGEAVGGVGGALGDLAGDAIRAGRPRTRTAVSGPVSEQRRVETLSIPLDDLKAIRAEHHHTVNDVILAVIAGGLRAWLLTRGESVSPSSGLTALVPMSVTEDDGVPTSLGSQVAPHLQALPIGEPSALMRLHQVAYGTQAHKDTGRAIDARTLSDIAGFAPTTLHALGMRVSGEVMRRQYDIVITNVPGPQQPVYAGGERLVASYPVLPLEPGHLLAIGVTSYDGQAFLALTGDRNALSDLPVLATCLRDAVEELRDTTLRGGGFRQPTRKASAAAKRAAAKKAAARQEAVRRAAGQRRAAVRSLANRAAELRLAAQQAAMEAVTVIPDPIRPPADRTTAKTTPAKRTATRKVTAAKATAAKKAAAEATPAKVTPAKVTPAKVTPAKVTPAKVTPAKAPAKAPAAKKTAAAKTAVQPPTSKRTAATKTAATKTPGTKPPAKKPPGTKTPATKTPTRTTPPKPDAGTS